MISRTLFRDLPYKGLTRIKITMVDNGRSLMKLQSTYGTHLVKIPYNRAGWKHIKVGDVYNVNLVLYEGTGHNDKVMCGKLEMEQHSLPCGTEH